MRSQSSSQSRTRQSSKFSLSTLASLLLILPSRTTAFDCSDVMADRQEFNFKSLGGPHQVHWTYDDDLSHLRHNYTFHIDICDNLKRQYGHCHTGARICGLREDIDLNEIKNTTHTSIDIAGTYKLRNNRDIAAKFSLLKNSKSNSDVDRDGVRAELHGGKDPLEGAGGTDQMAIIEFVCDEKRTGLEGDEKDDGDGLPDNAGDGDDKDGKDKEGDGKKEEGQKLRRQQKGKCEDTDASLRFCGYGVEDGEKGKKLDVLRLEWRTKYACRNAPADNSSSRWGFFTWFIIILFLAIAAYLIFGSWLNYNRYGARGWDLLPHGDTIRDVPYIMKDWARRVASTIQGSGSRGGYSAV